MTIKYTICGIPISKEKGLKIEEQYLKILNQFPSKPAFLDIEEKQKTISRINQIKLDIKNSK